MEEDQTGLMKMRRMAAGVYPHAIGLGIVSIVGVSVGIAKPVVFSRVIDQGLVENDWDTTFRLTKYLGLVGLFGLLTSSIHRILASYISNRIVENMRNWLVARVFVLQYEHFVQTPRGEILATIEDDCANIREFSVSTLQSAMRSFLSFVAAICYVGWVQWKMLLAGALAVPFMAICMRLFRRVVYECGSQVAEARAVAKNSLVNTVESMSSLRQLGLSDWSRDVIRGDLGKLRRSSIREQVWESLTELSSGSVSLFSYLVILGYGGLLVSTNEIGIGHLLAFLTMRQSFFAPLDFVDRVYKGYFKAKRSRERIDSLSSQPLETGFHGGDSIPDDFHPHSLSIEDVSFSFGDKALLCSANATFTTGWNELRGPNGSGKTTLLGIILKVRNPQQGRIFVDGYNVANFNNRSWRSHISVVAQEPFIFQGTLRENLRLFDENIDDSMIDSMLEQVGLRKWCEERGLDTELSQGGSEISGGLKQRLAIARALLRSSAVYIFDEPVSQVDLLTKGDLLRVMKRYTRGAIVIVISHSDLRDVADRIFHVKDGRVKGEEVKPEALCELDPSVQGVVGHPS